MKLINGTLLLLLIFMIWLHWFGNGGALDLREKKRLYQEQLEKNAKLEKRNQKLIAEVEDLRNGLEAIEERARSEMGMIKPDETFIQVIEDNGEN